MLEAEVLAHRKVREIKPLPDLSKHPLPVANFVTTVRAPLLDDCNTARDVAAADVAAPNPCLIQPRLMIAENNHALTDQSPGQPITAQSWAIPVQVRPDQDQSWSMRARSWPSRARSWSSRSELRAEPTPVLSETFSNINRHGHARTTFGYPPMGWRIFSKCGP